MKRILIAAIFCTVGIFLFTSNSFAENMELITDRPDKTESSSVIQPGYIQIESGFTFSQDEDSSSSSETYSLPETLLRIGLVDNVEFRLGWSGYTKKNTSTNNIETTKEGSDDAEIGAKVYLWEEDGWIPETAFLTGLSLPIGSNELSSQRADPSFLMSMSHTLSDKYSLGYNLGFAWETEENDSGDRDTTSSFTYSLALGRSITERLSSFVEIFGSESINSKSDSSTSLDGGFTYLLKENFQFDISAGLDLVNGADDWFAGVGFSVRLPN